MTYKWYIVHVYSGFENKVKSALEERIASSSNPQKFGEVIVPTEEIVELVKGKRKTSSRKFFPGYILLNVDLNDHTWHTVRDTPKVTGKETTRSGHCLPLGGSGLRLWPFPPAVHCHSQSGLPPLVTQTSWVM